MWSPIPRPYLVHSVHVQSLRDFWEIGIVHKTCSDTLTSLRHANFSWKIHPLMYEALMSLPTTSGEVQRFLTKGPHEYFKNNFLSQLVYAMHPGVSLQWSNQTQGSLVASVTTFPLLWRNIVYLCERCLPVTTPSHFPHFRSKPCCVPRSYEKGLPGSHPNSEEGK